MVKVLMQGTLCNALLALLSRHTHNLGMIMTSQLYIPAF